MASTDNEVALLKALLDACIESKKCVNVQQLWAASQGLLVAKDALIYSQRAERETEIAEANKMVRPYSVTHDAEWNNVLTQIYRIDPRFACECSMSRMGKRAGLTKNEPGLCKVAGDCVEQGVLWERS